jgi:phosphoribosylformimino-5-aminoimidazole carboxamide ribotide isomerase
VQFYPAIDVQGGHLARADRGGNPVAAAGGVAAAGVAWAHVVDLDRARGTGRDDATVRAVIRALDGVRVQLGGGLVDRGDIVEALGWGVARVVAGSDAVNQLSRLAAAFGSARLALSLVPRDAHPNERVLAPEELVGAAVDCGVLTVVYRDRDRDGTLSGAHLEEAARLLGRGAEIILAGGIATLDEIRRARDLGFGGVIVGRVVL